MSGRRAFTYMVIVIVVFLIGMIAGIYLERADGPSCEYCTTILKKLPTESTPAFFDRVHVTVDELNAQYNVYAFLPVFDTLAPVVIGAIIVYEVER